MKELDIYDTTSFFIDIVRKSINSEREVPGINFVFSDESIDFIKYVKDNYEVKSVNYTSISDEDIESLNSFNENFPFIKVTDPYRFFGLLTSICNNQVKLENVYGYKTDYLSKISTILRRIWLRCTSLDMLYIEDFLERQNDFIMNREFENNEKTDLELLGLKVSYNPLINNSYCETTRRMKLSISNYDLPSVYYDIRNENDEKVCYIYAIQNEKERNKDKKIERSLYKLNNGFNSPVHPSFTASMIIFFKLLKENGIDKIKVPLLEVLNYDYHVLLSKYTDAFFHNKWDRITDNIFESYKQIDINLYNSMVSELESDKNWYQNTVNKEDLISKNKTENLYNLFVFLNELNYCNIDGINLDDELTIKLLRK